MIAARCQLLAAAILCGMLWGEAARGDEPPGDAGRHLIVAVPGLVLDGGTRAMLAELKPGGVVLLGGNIRNKEQTRRLVRDIKLAAGEGTGIADFPLIYVDQEGGRINRLLLEDAPSAAALGRAGDALRARGIAASYGREAVARGIGVVLAPDLDLYEPGKSAVIGDRAFGGDPELVWRMGRAFAEGIADGGAIPVAKHFPGHGGTIEDSHTRLAHLNVSGDALDKALAPFQHAAAEGLPAIMVGHIACGALDPEHPELPATFSEAMVNGLLREAWGYRGMIITDDLNMKAIRGGSASAAVKALRAGCDAIMACDTDAAQLRRMRDVIAGEARDDPRFRESLAASRQRIALFRQRLAEVSAHAIDTSGELEPLQGPTAGGHVVKQGETLMKIAAQYGVSVQEIRQRNELAGDLIHIGQVLRIHE